MTNLKFKLSEFKDSYSNLTQEQLLKMEKSYRRTYKTKWSSYQYSEEFFDQNNLILIYHINLLLELLQEQEQDEKQQEQMVRKEFQQLQINSDLEKVVQFKELAIIELNKQAYFRNSQIKQQKALLIDQDLQLKQLNKLKQQLQHTNLESTNHIKTLQQQQLSFQEQINQLEEALCKSNKLSLNYISRQFDASNKLEEDLSKQLSRANEFILNIISAIESPYRSIDDILRLCLTQKMIIQQSQHHTKG